MSVKGQIVIPKELRKKMHLKIGDRLLLYSTDNIIMIRRVENYEPIFNTIAKPIRGKIRKLVITQSDVSKAIKDARKTKEKAENSL